MRTPKTATPSGCNTSSACCVSSGAYGVNAGRPSPRRSGRLKRTNGMNSEPFVNRLELPYNWTRSLRATPRRSCVNCSENLRGSGRARFGDASIQGAPCRPAGTSSVALACVPAAGRARVAARSTVTAGPLDTFPSPNAAHRPGNPAGAAFLTTSRANGACRSRSTPGQRGQAKARASREATQAGSPRKLRTAPGGNAPGCPRTGDLGLALTPGYPPTASTAVCVEAPGR